LVIKFGGSVLNGEENLRKAVSLVELKLREGYKVCIVVSALKGFTDFLINIATKINPKTPDDLLDEILSMGERTSARLFVNALISKGIDAIFIDPSSELWPIITDEIHLNANPVLYETRKRVQKLVHLLEEGKVVVVCGFIGKSLSGKLTTLGRGGSDTSAIVLGNALNAREVILVKDVAGVFSGDPKKIRNSSPIAELDPEEALILSSGGSKILHAKALAYKNDSMIVKITDIEGNGYTTINGSFSSFKIEVENEPITMVTVIARESFQSKYFMKLIEKIEELGLKIYLVNIDQKALLLYVSGNEEIENTIHDLVINEGIGKAISLFKNLRVVTIKGTFLETTPGVIQRIVKPLSEMKINIYGLVTIASSIKVFVRNEDVDLTVSSIKNEFEVKS